MKLRNLAILATTAVAVGANAADVRFFLAHANDATATLNGKAAGAEMSALTKVLPGLAFGVEIWVESTAAVDKIYGGGGAFLGFDTASTNNSTTGYANKAAAETAGLKKKLSFATADYAYGSIDGYANSDPSTALTLGIAGLNPKFRGAQRAGTAASVRSIGLNAALTFGTGFSAKMAPGSKYKVATMLVNHSIAGGDIFGDANDENGLTLNSYSPATSGANFMGNTAAGNPNVDVKYALQAVPEPGTVLAIGAGLAALVARRRRK